MTVKAQHIGPAEHRGDFRSYKVGERLVVPWQVMTMTEFEKDPSAINGVRVKREARPTGMVLHLLTPEEFDSLPDGTVVWSIFGERKQKGVDNIDRDTRMGRMAFGTQA